MKKARPDGLIFFPGVVLIFIGCLYLIVHITDLFYSHSGLSDSSELNEPIRWNEILAYLQTSFYVVFGIVGGIGLLTGKKWGWLLGVPCLGIYLIVASRGLYQLAVANMLNEGGYIFIGACSVFFICLFLLLLPHSYKKLHIKRSLLLPATLIFLMLLLLFIYIEIN